MCDYKKYASILDTECSVDYWSEQAINEAIRCLNDFDNNDWKELTQRLNEKNNTWQAQCAETLSEVQSEQNIYILIYLLNSANEDVIEAVVDSLNSISQSGVSVFLSEADADLVTKLVNRGGIIGRVASDLLKKLKVETKRMLH